ncbi:MAG: cytochrome c biogenesis protein CcsA [Planctomycetaceae bacterium]|nr:cytochrome c biogenesis protein CcsA [Planctomycetaceae bacterium]
MSSTTLPGELSSRREETSSLDNVVLNSAVKVLEILGSLKLTCVLFVLSMVIVFVGSLAQSRRDVWQVMEQYFRTWVAKIDVQDLFPPSMFSDIAQHYGVEDFGALVASKLGPFQSLPFPGGWTIGFIMLINLTAAHVLKFKVRARGAKLVAGIVLVALGMLLTYAVVVTGNMQMGVEFGQNTVLTPESIWLLMLAGLAAAGIAAIASAAMSGTMGPLSRWFLGGIGAVLLTVALAFLIGGEAARLNLSNMRILWQLLKGGACALVLLLGSNLLFDKRGGIAVLHFGVALLMISELQVGLQAKENMLSLLEGETSSFVRDIRVRELAIISQKDNQKDNVVAIPEARLEDAAKAASRVTDAANKSNLAGGPIIPAQVIQLSEAPYALPFDIAVRRFYRNSKQRAVMPGDEMRLESGLGKFSVATELPPVTGMEESNDVSAVYVDLLEKGSQKVIQSLLVSQNASELRGVPFAETATVDGKEYQFYLRFQRSYQPYSVKLIDVSRTNYIGTSTPRDYRSVIQISEPGSDETEEFSVWMNNPLRFKGETFYQTGHQDLGGGKEMTTLSVVNNQGWMLPYIACMIAMFGMFAQFGQTLFRFLDRSVRTPELAGVPSDAISSDVRPGFGPARSEAKPVDKEAATPAEPSTPFILKYGIPIVVTLIFAMWLGRKAMPPKIVANTMNLYGFAQLPVAWSGRPQPIDSMARVQLLAASHKSTFEGEMDAAELSSPERREKVLQAIAKGWPTVDLSKFTDFNGSYTEWIEKIKDLTASGEEAIEARMRSVMVRKMPAVHWLLDVMTRPEVAARHRIYKIEDDNLLSLLGLEKRAGLTYSLIEIQKNFKALEPILQASRKKQENKQENLLTPIERRVGALFETMGRVDQLSQVFILRESDGLLGAYVDSWRVLRLLGNTAPVSPVPTGSTNETRSWETMIAANSVRQLNEHMTDNGIVSLEDFIAFIHEKLPKEIVTQSITGSYRILLDQLPKNTDAARTGDEGVDVRDKAAEAAARVPDEFLKEILQVIADSDPKQTPEEIAAALPAETMQDMASARISSEMFDVFSTISERTPDDKRLQAIRTRLQKIGADDPKVLSLAMNDELIRLVWDDLQARVGHLMPGGENMATFNTNALAVKDILVGWEQGDLNAFNTSIEKYSETLKAHPVPHLNTGVVKLEAWFNFVEPFYLAINIYLPIIVLSFAGWLVWGRVLRNTSLFLLVLAFVLHTAALILRMWISGRPPVTNLYSSAIFIGWGVVLGSFFIELLLKRGIGNLIGASVGAATLVIAHYLARDEGDTLGVMQAVLDTTFWLATHVVCITLGYVATLVGGCMGIAYCVMAALNPRRAGLRATDKPTDEFKLFGKMVYGVICFAIFFSLVGTVLGGLWADDSWGRFWGWDPKENGAMMIVLWNAIILHARWGKLVRDYGTAVLAVVGNAVTAWSWFGVNELKAGLHSYGFTEGRLLAMVGFMAIQIALVLAFAAFAMLLRKYAARPALQTK